MIASGSAPSAYGDELYRKLNARQDALAAQGVDYYERRAQIKAEKAVIDAELEQRWQRVWRAYNTSSKESEKQQRYAHEQCNLLRALEDLAATERIMYELDNRKDHVMTVCKLAAFQCGDVDPRALFSCQLCPRHLGTAGPFLPTQRSGRLNTAHGLCRTVPFQ